MSPIGRCHFEDSLPHPGEGAKTGSEVGHRQVPQHVLSAMIQDMGWRDLHQRRADSRLCIPYKISQGLVDIPLVNS